MARMTVFDRIETKIFRDGVTDCWHWSGAAQPSGYGVLWNGARVEQAHRVSYRAFIGPIPDGMEIDHICRVRGCVNPIHLRAVTHQENMRCSATVMAENAAKIACKNGHPFAGSNLRITNNGARQCRQCINQYARLRRKGRQANG